jgi:hypothetical protein
MRRPPFDAPVSGTSRVKEQGMRVLVLVKATEDSEKENFADHLDEFEEMGRFNDELTKAGVMLAGDGLAPSSEGKRVVFGGAEQRVVDGPFAEAKELVAGFWIWQVSSMEEAVEWLKRAPFKEGAVEIRRIYEESDLEALLPAER